MAVFNRTEYVDALRAVDGKWAVKDEDGNIVTWEHEEFLERFSPTHGYICGMCGNHINKYTDLYYFWSDNLEDEDAAFHHNPQYLCEICGGKDGARPVSVLGRLDHYEF